MRKDEIIEIFKNIPTLTTERLVLRKILPEDYRDMYEYSRSETVTRYLLWSAHRSIDYTRRYAEFLQSEYAIGDFYDFAVVLKDSGKMIGTVGFSCFHFDTSSAELGYVLNEEYWGHGYASEAAERVIEFGFEVLGLKEIIAKYMSENTASERVMLRCNMKKAPPKRTFIFRNRKKNYISFCSILSSDFYRNRKQ